MQASIFIFDFLTHRIKFTKFTILLQTENSPDSRLKFTQVVWVAPPSEDDCVIRSYFTSSGVEEYFTSGVA